MTRLRNDGALSERGEIKDKRLPGTVSAGKRFVPCSVWSGNLHTTEIQRSVPSREFDVRDAYLRGHRRLYRSCLCSAGPEAVPDRQSARCGAPNARDRLSVTNGKLTYRNPHTKACLDAHHVLWRRCCAFDGLPLARGEHLTGMLRQQYSTAFRFQRGSRFCVVASS